MKTEQYNINGKVVVFNMYEDNGTTCMSVDVYEDTEKTDRAVVDNVLAEKIDELICGGTIFKNNNKSLEDVISAKGVTNISTGVTLSNSVTGTGLGENPNIRVSHYTKRDKYEKDYYVVNEYYDGTLTIVYNGSLTLSSMKLTEAITARSANVEMSFPTGYRENSDGTRATRTYTWDSSEVGYLRLLNRGTFSATYLTETNVVNIDTTGSITYGNEGSSVTVSSTW